MSEQIEQSEASEGGKLLPYSTPTWVKALGVAAIILFLLIAILMLTGEHGAGGHSPSVETTTTMDGE